MKKQFSSNFGFALTLVATMVFFFGCSLEKRPGAGDMGGNVTLSISRSSAVRDEECVYITCLAVLDNRTDSPLVVKSGFFSAFDGLSVLVRTQDGKELGKTSFLMHQSPYTFESRDFPLPLGKTTHKLSFFSHVIPAEVQRILIQVVGDLPGSGYDRQLRSNSMTIPIAKEKT